VYCAAIADAAAVRSCTQIRRTTVTA